MKVNDVINKTELELDRAALIDLVANKDRQIDLVFAAPKTDDVGYLRWDTENWTCVDGKRFICSYALEGRVLSEYSSFNKYDMQDAFAPETAAEVRLN